MNKKKYISANLNVVTLSTNVIATSITDPTTPGPTNGYEEGLEQFAPTRRGRYDAEYDLY